MSPRARRQIMYQAKNMAQLSYIRANKHTVKMQSNANFDKAASAMDSYLDDALKLSKQPISGNKNFTVLDGKLLDSHEENVKIRRTMNRSMLESFHKTGNNLNEPIANGMPQNKNNQNFMNATLTTVYKLQSGQNRKSPTNVFLNRQRALTNHRTMRLNEKKDSIGRGQLQGRNINI